MRFSILKKEVMKFFIIISVCLSLSAGPAASNEVNKMLECISGVSDAKMKELDDEEDETGEPEKKK
ncbi:MAG: hypothetical protein K0S01_3652 [Herbinix sp.]|jgi:hypothetical protein|nr:hypothetical protein [Herbinix sp.]